MTMDSLDLVDSIKFSNSKMNSEKKYFVTKEEDYVEILKMYEKTPDDVKESLKILKEWLKKQPHLPQEQTDDELKILLIKNKFRIEHTKNKIENYYSLKCNYVELLSDRKISENIRLATKVVNYFPLPILGANKERIMFSRVNKIKNESIDFCSLAKYILMTIEYLQFNDICTGILSISDESGISKENLTFNFADYLMKVSQFYTKSFSNKIYGVQFFKSPLVFEIVLKVLKTCLPAKLVDRMVVHDSSVEIKDLFDKKLLPKDYGGELPSVDQLQEEWLDFLQSKTEWFEKMTSKKSNETLRIGPSPHNNMFGIDGSFKKLNLD